MQVGADAARQLLYQSAGFTQLQLCTASFLAETHAKKAIPAVASTVWTSADGHKCMRVLWQASFNGQLCVSRLEKARDDHAKSQILCQAALVDQV